MAALKKKKIKWSKHLDGSGSRIKASGKIKIAVKRKTVVKKPIRKTKKKVSVLDLKRSKKNPIIEKVRTGESHILPYWSGNEGDS